jgi:glutaredoxin
LKWVLTFILVFLYIESYMKIVIYTITDCPFSKAEKEYLTAKNLQFEEKNLETSKEFLTEMMSVSDDFAGVPFTIITKDDGTELKMKGFTKEDFEKELSAGSDTSASSAGSAASVKPAVPASVPVSSMIPPEAPKTDDLSNVMNTLSSMSSTQPSAMNGQGSAQMASADPGMAIPDMSDKSATSAASAEPAKSDTSAQSDISDKSAMPVPVADTITPSVPTTPAVPIAEAPQVPDFPQS